MNSSSSPEEAANSGPKADISIRESIAWLPDPPSEPTSTIVLTSPGRHFVDVRILLPLDPSSGILTPDSLDWAFAGTSSSTPLSPSLAPSSSFREASGDGLVHVHSTWHHSIDSRHADASLVSDSGYMTIYPSGRAVESGSMVNPATGLETEYEEVWMPGPEVGDREPVMVLRTGMEGGGEDGSGPGTRGTVVRLDRWAQGIVRNGETVAVRRWEKEAGEKGLWKVVAALENGETGRKLDFGMEVATGKTGVECRRVGGTAVDKKYGVRWEVVEVGGQWL